MSNNTFENVYLRGMHFRGSHAKEYVDMLEEGQIMYLVREPDNAYDPNAIQVWNQPEDQGGFHFAYVAGEMTSWIAPLLDDGLEFHARVTGVDRSSKTAYPVVTIEPAGD